MPDRSIAPAFAEPKPFELPVPEIEYLDNGSRFFFFNAGDQPIIKLEFIFRAGSWFEAAPGVAFFTGKMLTEGTAHYTSKGISEALDQYGAFVEINPGFDYTNLSIHIPTKHAEKIDSILEEILRAPSFPDHEFEHMKQIQIQQLRINEQKNRFVASRAFRSGLYGSHPYGHVMTEEAIQQISVEDLNSHYHQLMKGKYDMFLTGDFDAALQLRIINLFASNLAEVNEFGNRKPEPVAHFDKYIEREESMQSSIFMGKRSINRDDERYAGLLLLNEVFGGYFGSRLMQNIREEKGYTYGISSHLVSLKNDAYFVINSDVKKEYRNETIREIQSEIDKLRNELICDAELKLAKNSLKGSILNTLTTPFALTEKLKNIYFYDLDIDFYNRIFDQIDQATNSDLSILANELLFDRKLSSVVVG